MNLQTAQTLALELMQLHGVTEMGYTFAFNNARRAAGKCKYFSKRIELSKHLTALADDVDVKDTILHEIAHALTKGHGHDYVWQRKAKEIGCNGQRCYNINNKESLAIAYKMVAKYKAVCKNGHEHFLNRMPKVARSCGYCSRRFNPNELLTYKPA